MKYIGIRRTKLGAIHIQFPQTGRVWAMSNNWSIRQWIIVSLFAFEQLFPNISKVIGDQFTV